MRCLARLVTGGLVALLAASSVQAQVISYSYGFSPSGITTAGFVPSGFTNFGFAPLGFTNFGFAPSGFTNFGFALSGFTNFGFAPSGFTNFGFAPSGFTSFTPFGTTTYATGFRGQSWRRRGPTTVFAPPLLIPASPGTGKGGNGSTAEDIARIKSRLDRVEADIKQIRKDVEKLAGQKTTKEAELLPVPRLNIPDDVKKKLADLDEQDKKLGQTIKQVRAKMAAKTQTEADIKQLQDALDAHVRINEERNKLLQGIQ